MACTSSMLLVRNQIRLTMQNILIAAMFQLGVAVLGAMGLGVFVHALLTNGDMATLVISGCVAFVGVVSLVELIRTWLSIT